MRKDHEVIDLILNVAKHDTRIRAVLLNGSRADAEAKKDFLQDFDIVYIVNNLKSFTSNHSWVNIFGEQLIMQMPADMTLEEQYAEEKNVSFSYLMLFKDYNRIDLTLFPLERFDDSFKHDIHNTLLLDKDNLFNAVHLTVPDNYLIKVPTQKIYSDCCNEFWWVCTYVAKGLWRNEILYAKDMLEGPVRIMFMKIIEWHVGTQTGFSVSIGKSGKRIETCVSPMLYKKILSTYPDAGCKNIWNALFLMTGIFRELSLSVAEVLCFNYDKSEDDNVMQYLNWVYNLYKEKPVAE